MPGQAPQQMPPQGAPQGPQDAQAPQGPQAGGAPAGAIQELFQNIDQAVDHAASILGKAPGAPPAAKQLIQQIDQLMGHLMDVLGGGQGGDDQSGPSAQGQTTPMEAGGNKGAVPAP